MAAEPAAKAGNDAPWHVHVYFDTESRVEADALRDRFLALAAAASEPPIRFVGRLAEGPVGPHPLPQFEIHFDEPARGRVIALIASTGLRALVHPLTDDDLADHTTLGQWIGEPLELDTTVLDPPGINRGVARFGVSDF